MTVDRATPIMSETGEKFSYCRLAESGKFEIVSDEEVRQAGILRNG